MLSSYFDYKKHFKPFSFIYFYANCLFFILYFILCLHGTAWKYKNKYTHKFPMLVILFYENSFVTILKLSTVNNRPFHFPRNTQITPLMESVNRKLPRPYTHFTFPQQI